MKIVGNGYISQQGYVLKSDIAKDLGFQATLENAALNSDRHTLKAACQDFESYFLSMMFKEMRKTVHSEDGIIPKSQSEQIFQEMVDEEVCKNISKGSGIGLATFLYKQLSNQYGDDNTQNDKYMKISEGFANND